MTGYLLAAGLYAWAALLTAQFLSDVTDGDRRSIWIWLLVLAIAICWPLIIPAYWLSMAVKAFGEFLKARGIV